MSVFQKIIDFLRGKKDYLQIHGVNNDITFNKKSKAKLIIWGNNNKVELDESLTIFPCTIYIGSKECPTNDCVVKVGKNTTVAAPMEIRIWEDNSVVEIGEDCMFSSGIKLSCTDTHAIFDVNTKELINSGSFIKIGSHVWLGESVSVLKNSSIPKNCIVGSHSVITNVFDEENCVIAGIPAKVRKHNVGWSRLRPKQYADSLHLGGGGLKALFEKRFRAATTICVKFNRWQRNLCFWWFKWRIWCNFIWNAA